MRKVLLGRGSALIAAVLTAASLAPRSGAAAAVAETVLYSFCAQSGCTDGAEPSGLITDAAGKLYGTTSVGGAHGSGKQGGTVFELTPNATKTKWTETVLYSFCVQDGTNCTGTNLILDASGHFYGTTGPGNLDAPPGLVFELTPNAAKTTWTETVLYSFCAESDCTDGEDPEDLILDASGKLYGTTGSGGAVGPGAVFELTPNAAKTKWTETVLYSFCGSRCTEGDAFGDLILDAAGKLYGTTWVSDARAEARGSRKNKGGEVFELTSNAAKTTWTHKILYSFCVQGGTNCTDGKNPGSLLRDTSGRLYGTTDEGGAHGGGTVFALP
jgi:uncharacterized repeat protein (TIGR03803 family)